MKRKKTPLILFAVILILAGAGAYYWMHRKKSSDRGGQERRVVEVTKGTISESVEATGEVEPLNRVEIKPPVSGRVEKLLVDEGGRVKSGEVLAWMSSTDRAAVLDAARAKGPEELKKWEDTYKPTPVVAPLSGVIILKNVVVGQTVEPSAILFAMSDKLIVRADIDETDIGRVRMAMPAVITLDAYPDAPIQGKVFQILYEGKNVSNVITYGAKIEPINVPHFFRSQMTANISLIINKRDDVLLLPAVAVNVTPAGEKQVLIPAEKGEKPTPRAVKTGVESGDKIEIVEGLAEGERVLIAGKRYTPQRAASQSPLIMQGPQRGQGQNQGGSGSGGGAKRQRQ